MKIIDAYINAESGDIATLDDWRVDFEDMGPDRWFGGAIDEIEDKRDWVRAGGLYPVELTITSGAIKIAGELPHVIAENEEYGIKAKVFFSPAKHEKTINGFNIQHIERIN